MLANLYKKIKIMFNRFFDNKFRGPNENIDSIPDRKSKINGTIKPKNPNLPKKFTPISILNALEEHNTRKWSKRKLSEIDKIIVHQSMSGGSTFGVNKYHIGPNHISSRGCPKICYTYSIEKDGTVYQCNELTDITWHCKGENTASIGVLVIGDFDGPEYKGSEEPTKDQIKSLYNLLDYIKSELNKNILIYGHDYFGKKACPGDIIHIRLLEYKHNE